MKHNIYCFDCLYMPADRCTNTTNGLPAATPTTPRCGAFVAKQATSTACPFCHLPVAPAAAFCGECGTMVEARLRAGIIWITQ